MLGGAFQTVHELQPFTYTKKVQVENLYTMLRERHADSLWYSTLIFIWTPDAEIFDKSYEFKRARELPPEPMMYNRDGLFHVGMK